MEKLFVLHNLFNGSVFIELEELLGESVWTVILLDCEGNISARLIRQELHGEVFDDAIILHILFNGGEESVIHILSHTVSDGVLSVNLEGDLIYLLLGGLAKRGDHVMLTDRVEIRVESLHAWNTFCFTVFGHLTFGVIDLEDETSCCLIEGVGHCVVESEHVKELLRFNVSGKDGDRESLGNLTSNVGVEVSLLTTE